MKSAALPIIQRQSIPPGFSLDMEYGCLTNAEALAEANPALRFVVGNTRIIGETTWGEHAWCETGEGQIIDPYFMQRFTSTWNRIEYVEDLAAFDGAYGEQD